jgi:hypothetical protein
MLEWLKAILGDGYTEEIDKEVSAEIGKGFVSKADFNAKNEELKAAKGRLGEANQTIEGFQSLDIEGIKKAAEEWKAKAEKAEADAAAKIADLEFQSLLSSAITRAKGKNEKAVAALLDLDALKASKDQERDLKSALEALKGEHGYLFETEQTPPPYAPGTGTHPVTGKYTPEEVAIRAAAGLKVE